LFLTLELDGGQWSAYRPSCLVLLTAHTLEGWVDVSERENSSTCCKSYVGWCSNSRLSYRCIQGAVGWGLSISWRKSGLLEDCVYVGTSQSLATPLTAATATELDTTLIYNIPARVSRPRTSRGQSPAYCREGPCSILGQSIWDLWRTS